MDKGTEAKEKQKPRKKTQEEMRTSGCLDRKLQSCGPAVLKGFSDLAEWKEIKE